MTGAPGISIRAVLNAAPEQALWNYVGCATINVLTALNPELVTRQNLVEIAIQAYEPIAVIRRHEVLTKIIELLPLLKAQEFADRLRVRGQGTELYKKLIVAASDRKNESNVMSFFGVVVYERAPGVSEAPEKIILPKYGLFPHQKQVADKALEAIKEHPFKVVVHMPTGAGKTRTAMHIVADALNRNPTRLVVWLAQTGELLEQAAEEFERAWSSLGVFDTKVYRFWGDYEPNIEDVKYGLLVAGFGKLYAVLKRDANMIMRLGDRAVLTVVDEAHQAIAPTYKALIGYIQEKKPGNALLGLTATPGRTWADIASDAELADFFGNRKVTLEVEGYSNPVKYLIAEGYLAKPSFKTLNVNAGFSLSEEDLRYLSEQHDIPAEILNRLADDEQRNIRIITCVEELEKSHRRIIVFAATVQHAHLIRSILSLRGTKAFVVTGNTDKLERERILVKFKSEDPDPVVLCNYGVLTTGFDAPKTSAAVIARPTRSLVLYSQMVGRAIRGERAGGNRTAEIVTIVDPQLPGFGDIADAFINWEDVWDNGKN